MTTGPNARIRLGTVEAEAEKCRKAFAKTKIGAIVQHCHHAQWLEILTDEAGSRVSFIINNKNEGERALRLRLFRPLTPGAYRKLPAKLREADAEWKKAYAEWQKADAEWQKAYAEWKKAYAEWKKADAEWKKAYAEWQKAYADRQKAYAEWQKADADRQKAYAEWKKADADPKQQKALLALHRDVCGCQWSKTTDIFGDRR